MRSLVPLVLSAAFAKAASSTSSLPLDSGVVTGQFKLIGNSLVSAQQAFLGTAKKVYFVDKTENNPSQVNGHPAWAAEYSLDGNTARPMDIVTNTFCAGGNVLGNGTWINVGGNQAVGPGGLTAASQTGGGIYDDLDGGVSIRFLDPCDDESCNWVVPTDLDLTSRRWYPAIETLEDGSVIIIGGDDFGGFINSASQSNPTYEFFPSKTDGAVPMALLQNTLPANLYPITFLLPSGNLYIQANWASMSFDYKANDFTGMENPLPDVPDAVRTYPASGGSIMHPLTPANNWTATLLFCGGTDLQPDQWDVNNNLAVTPTSSSCVSITPDEPGANYTEDDPLPAGRVMVNLIHLPTGEIFVVNGAGMGVAGYGNNSWAIGQSYAQDPVLQPLIYNPNSPPGSRFSSAGLSPSTIPRLYHSSAILAPDGSVIVSGSNPNADYTVGPGVVFPTEYRVEKFYPSYYNERRPEPLGLPSTLSYGGPYFNVTLSSEDLNGSMNNLKNTTVVVIRPGFSTHAINMGQRFVQLDNTYTANADGSGTLHVSQLPPNPAILAPGPAFIFVVVNGVPSIGVQVMCGSGTVGAQPILDAVDLPPSTLAVKTNDTDANSSPHGKNGASEQLNVSSSFVSIFALANILYWTML